ncbi:MAG: RHS repeat-associated core domain-containing protein [Pirellulales bacterium]|nr:RHS repeat-associated core domain-containing protein [Pirellulales bacterium]
MDDYGVGSITRTEAYVYDGNQIVPRFADDDAAALTPSDLRNRYLWGPAVDQLLAEENVAWYYAPGTVDWALSDHQHTVRDWVRSSGGSTTLADHAQYDAFGNRLDAPTVDSLFGYTGRYHDDDTGLQWNGSSQGGGRWYDSATGRWLSEDAIGFRGDASNLYRYVENRATIFVDPSGMEREGEHKPLGDLAAALEGIAKSEKCKAEARQIAGAIQNSWDHNWRASAPWRQTVKGYWCYEWAYGFEGAFKLESSGDCFKVETGGVAAGDDPDGPVHAWIKIISTETGQSVYVDDGFAYSDRSQVHTVPPIPGGYGPREWWPTHNPRKDCNIPKAYPYVPPKPKEPPPPPAPHRSTIFGPVTPEEIYQIRPYRGPTA